jgi:predicted nucleotide-binding protein (sugar kinase/HSP70/actin superfamily)
METEVISVKDFLEEKINAQKDFMVQILKERDERLAQKFESLAMAINKAEMATEKRFESVNEFRATLTDQQKTFLTSSEYKSAHQNLVDLVSTSGKNLSDNILSQKERIDKLDNIKQGGQNLWVLIIGIVAIATSMLSFILGLFGK